MFEFQAKSKADGRNLTATVTHSLELEFCDPGVSPLVSAMSEKDRTTWRQTARAVSVDNQSKEDQIGEGMACKRQLCVDTWLWPRLKGFEGLITTAGYRLFNPVRDRTDRPIFGNSNARTCA